MDKTIAAWEDDGGSPAPFSERRMIGKLDQIAWALQIKSHVEAEFERLRAVLEHAIREQSPKGLRDIEAIIRILEDKRAEVLENEQAGYFTHNWQDWGIRCPDGCRRSPVSGDQSEPPSADSG